MRNYLGRIASRFNRPSAYKARRLLPREAGKGDRPKGGGRGVSLASRSAAAGPLHHTSCGPPPPHFVRGRMHRRRHCEKRQRRSNPASTQAALDCFAALAMDDVENRSRDALTRPSFAHHHDASSKNRFASCKQREAERRKAHAIHVRAIANKCTQFAPLVCSAAARILLRGAPAFRRSRLRHSPSAVTPMAQPQNRVSRRRTWRVFCPRGLLLLAK